MYSIPPLPNSLFLLQLKTVHNITLFSVSQLFSASLRSAKCTIKETMFVLQWSVRSTLTMQCTTNFHEVRDEFDA